MSDQRSGSTLLDNILSSAPNAISVGELRLLSDHINKGKFGRTWNWECSCGKNINKCPFWSEVIANLDKMGYDRVTNTVLEKNSNKNNITITILNNIYKIIYQIKNNKVIIDSSKNEYQALALYQNSEIKMKIIYLKRDIRAIAYSKHKWEKKFNGENTSLLKKMLACKIKEIKLRSVANKIKRDDIMIVNYESLSKSTSSTINEIIEKFGLDPFEIPKYVYSGNQHTIAGTPNRFTKKKIKYDDTWTKDMKKNKIFNIAGSILKYI